MKYNFGKIKRKIAFLLIFLMSINSFATSVSDNDGSAFITKAEFDALKSNFQAQINSYNQNIDNKIDTAIASYLSGITINRTTEKNLLLVNESKIGYFDDAIYQYKYGRPSIGINATLTYKSITSTRYECGFAKVVWSTDGSPASGFVSEVLDYEINGSSQINVKKCKLVDYYDKYNTVLSANGDGTYECVTGLSGFQYYRYWFSPSNGGSSFAVLNNQFDSDTFIKSQYYQNSTAGSKPSKTIDDFYKSRNNMVSLELASNKNIYFIAYDGSQKKLLLNQNSLPFCFLGANDFVSPDTTESAKTMNSATSTNASGGKLELIAGDPPAAGYGRAIINSSKLTVPDAKNDTVGIFGGLGYFDGHKIIQDVTSFENSALGITVNDVTLAAGLPLMIEKKERQIIWKPKFIDSSKTYRVWLSYDAFDSKNYTTYHGKPNNTLDYVDINEKVSGQKYAEITGGTGTLTWDMAKDSIVYMKWAEMNAGTENASGILDISGCGNYTSIIKND